MESPPGRSLCAACALLLSSTRFRPWRAQLRGPLISRSSRPAVDGIWVSAYRLVSCWSHLPLGERRSDVSSESVLAISVARSPGWAFAAARLEGFGPPHRRVAGAFPRLLVRTVDRKHVSAVPCTGCNTGVPYAPVVRGKQSHGPFPAYPPFFSICY